MKTAIIVLSWGEPELTEQCFRSLYKSDLLSEHYHLFWVQNEFSRDLSKMQIIEHELITNQVPHTIIKNEQNLGFPGGVNSALRVVLEQDFDWVCFLNNDTKLTPMWLYTLISSMPENCGAIGPLVDNGGFQRIHHMHRLHPDSVFGLETDEHVVHYSNRAKGNPTPFIRTQLLAFFCTVLPVSVVREIGYLDEAFGMGYGEDNDYCIRLNKAGYLMGVCPRVAIHHDHGGTSKLSPEERREVGRKATKILEGKWNEPLP